MQDNNTDERKERKEHNADVLNFRDLAFPVDRYDAFDPIRSTVREMSGVTDYQRMADMVETLSTCSEWLIRRVQDNRLSADEQRKAAEMRARALELAAAQDSVASLKSAAQERAEAAKAAVADLDAARKRLAALRDPSASGDA